MSKRRRFDDPLMGRRALIKRVPISNILARIEDIVDDGRRGSLTPIQRFVHFGRLVEAREKLVALLAQGRKNVFATPRGIYEHSNATGPIISQILLRH